MKIKIYSSILTWSFLASLVLNFSGPAVAQPKVKALADKDKAINLQAFVGPYGEAYTPPELATSGGYKPVSTEDLFFPSMYFMISAKPNIETVIKEDRTPYPNYEFKGLGLDLKWLRVSLELKAIPCSTGGGRIPGAANDPEAVRVLQLLPEVTEEALEDQRPAVIAEAANQMVTKLVPLIPLEKSVVEGASGATSILFKNLFPPKTVASSYAFIDNYSSFGWYWKRRDIKEKAESVLGLRRGIVLLRIKRGFKGVVVKYHVEANWSDDPSAQVDDEYADVDYLPYHKNKNSAAAPGVDPNADVILFDEKRACNQPTVKELYERIDYKYLKNLDEFPLLVPSDVVCKIYQKTDTCDPASLGLTVITEGTKKFVLREDLRKALGIKETKPAANP